MADKTEKELLADIHSMMIDHNGRPGLCTQVERNTRQIQKLWIVIAIVIASAGGGTYGIIELLKQVALGG